MVLIRGDCEDFSCMWMAFHQAVYQLYLNMLLSRQD